MATVLMPLPQRDFDPTESAVPWQYLRANRHSVVFATPDGKPAQADPRMLKGDGLGIFAPLLMARADAQISYKAMAESEEFLSPIRYTDISLNDFQAILLCGGHAPGMKVYLESLPLQQMLSLAFKRNFPIGAICHGVVLAARSRTIDGKSNLYGRKVTALTSQLEMSAWLLTCAWLGNYYRTYPVTVEAEVKNALRDKSDFLSGPVALLRDGPDTLSRGFVIKDGNFISARWPGDAYRFANEFNALLG